MTGEVRRSYRKLAVAAFLLLYWMGARTRPSTFSLVYVLLGRFFMRGMMAGALKG